MISHCLKCKRYRKHNPRVLKTSNGKIMLLLKCAIFGSKQGRFNNSKCQMDY